MSTSDHILSLWLEVDKRARDAAHAAAVHFGLYFARCESGALAGDLATWTRHVRAMLLNDRCIATRRAVRNAGKARERDAFACIERHQAFALAPVRVRPDIS